ncbi:MAG: hypothetical protein HOL85_09020 [Rhodospirillaceae bacterium]|nr:hypothetical protein [Rhodospirillaceae bacterium]MBT6139710.1 hypothetical protein [Rhodospirillaceae bacterium]
MALATALATILVTTQVMADTAFVDGFEDMPAMPGMTAIPDGSVSFDTASGRIIVAFMRTTAYRHEILAFYESALAELGWRLRTDQRYVREGEVLSLDLTRDGSATIVRYSLKPE